MNIIYKGGYSSYQYGIDKDGCPYTKHSSDYVDWMDGWFDAQLDNCRAESDDGFANLGKGFRDFGTK